VLGARRWRHRRIPPGDPQWQGAFSTSADAAVVSARGGVIAHLDLTIIAESPKIGPHRDAAVSQRSQASVWTASKQPRAGLHRPRRGHRRLRHRYHPPSVRSRAVTDLAPLTPLASELIAEGTARGVKIATAESCTGGLILGVLTEIAGSAAVVDRGFVTYSNEARPRCWRAGRPHRACRGGEQGGRSLVEARLPAPRPTLPYRSPASPTGRRHETSRSASFICAMRGGLVRYAERRFRRHRAFGNPPATVREAC
jgi:nicotinamide-nucleotide amidase